MFDIWRFLREMNWRILRIWVAGLVAFFKALLGLLDILAKRVQFPKAKDQENDHEKKDNFGYAEHEYTLAKDHDDNVVNRVRVYRDRKSSQIEDSSQKDPCKESEQE